MSFLAVRFGVGLVCIHSLVLAADPGELGDMDRAKWAATSTVGIPSLAGGVISSAWGTAFNKPEEYGLHWDGFGKRYGLRLTGIATSNAMEAGLGRFWGEDPRYSRAAGQPLKSRIGNIVRMTFLARNADGSTKPAYARYAAIPGSNFLSNTWRPDSEAEATNALIRTSLGFLGRMASNTFAEFWPDVKSRIFK
ncbi:MAG: hypothetical protein M3O20_12675 [Acidobacteriota bacterium]|nr:hypothetical protein [Acidobacteriota bacterium]